MDLTKYSAIVVSDYQKGFFSDDLLQFLINKCNERLIPIFIDTKNKNNLSIKNAFCLKINENEFNSGIFDKIRNAGLEHPSPEIGAELTTIIGTANSANLALDKDSSDSLQNLRENYQNYRFVWVSRIRQYIDDHERLISQQKPID